MNNGIYGIAGVYPDRTQNDGAIDSEKEVYEALKNIPEHAKLIELFALKASTPIRITVNDVTALTSAQLDALRCGDQVIKEDSPKFQHAYTVSYKDEDKGELSLTYADHQNVEEVYYEKVEGTWTYIQTDNTHIGN